MSQGVKTTCPYCGVGCGVIARKQADGTVEVAGDPDHPANFGRLCSKGSALGETIDLDGRLLAPEIHGKPSDWNGALDLVAERFVDTIAEHGPDSVAFYVSGQILTEDYYVANKLMKGFIGSGNIDTNSRLCMASSVAGHRRAFGTDTVPGVYEDLELADIVVLVGSNLLWCHPVLYQRVAAAKAKRPDMRVVLVDPRRTKTADLADMHLAIEPDSDGALFNGLLRWLDQRDHADSDWIAAHTSGFESAMDAAGPWSVAAVAQATGLGASEVEAFYRLWSDHEKVVTAYSQGVNQSAVGTDKVNAIINCHLATARIGKPGMGPFSLTGQPNAMGGRETGGLANMLAAHMDIENPMHRARVAAFWNTANLAGKPGLKAVDMFQAVGDGRIKALWIMATNPVVSMPDADTVEAAIANCPFVVVSDVMAKTDTTRHAHVKLPSLGWGEKDGTVTNSERRISRQRAFLPAPGQAKADWWQLAEVASRMGFGDAFAYRDAATIFREFAALTAIENEDDRDLHLGAVSTVGVEEYKALPPFQWPQIRRFDPSRQTRFFANGFFYTPDRKARFVAVNPPTTIAQSSMFRLNTGRVRDQWHTMTRTAKAARLNAHMSEPYCEIHPCDAARLSIAHADLVHLKGQGVSVIARALITPDQMSGHVFVPMHWNDQYASAARVGALVPPATDQFSGQPALKGAIISVEKAAMEAHGFMVSRRKPDTDGLDYWALAKTENGWRLEFALCDMPDKPADFLSDLVAAGGKHLSASDAHRGFWRAAHFVGDTMQAAAYMASSPVEVSRSWASGLITTEFETVKDRWRVLAGRPAADMPEKGAIVCSCMSVGINDIAGAVRSGCHTVEAVGRATQAGTNCGSCKAEITEIIDAHRLVAAE
ncbi:MAG: nitrate reductase [Roseitalea sp.]|jgi:assimilatory nitrate reductase catalytic subunit|nr:nitrate reductase [Roseitalea sp.]MBO6721185.1 nitrate reductase [Roseitalea sp.]MBO6744243.1 nitrate reductase [Roseitalea sp.]